VSWSYQLFVAARPVRKAAGQLEPAPLAQERLNSRPRHLPLPVQRPRKVPSLVRTRRAPPRIAGRVAPLACAVRDLGCRPLRHPRRPVVPREGLAPRAGGSRRRRPVRALRREQVRGWTLRPLSPPKPDIQSPKRVSRSASVMCQGSALWKYLQRRHFKCGMSCAKSGVPKKGANIPNVSAHKCRNIRNICSFLRKM
jgi:hypothetical protein